MALGQWRRPCYGGAGAAMAAAGALSPLARLRDLHTKSVPFFECDRRKQWGSKFSGLPRLKGLKCVFSVLDIRI